MFDIGFWEIIIIVLVALLVVGPERLPGLAREIGRFVGKTRRFVHSVRSDFEQELQADELRNMLKSQDREIRQLKDMMQETETSLREDIEDTEKHLREDIEGTSGKQQADGGTRKGLSEDEQKALADKPRKPPVREKASMQAPESSTDDTPAPAEADASPHAAEADDLPAHERATDIRRVPLQSEPNADMLTEDPALAAERRARAADDKPAARRKRPRKADAAPDADTTHDDQTPDRNS